MAGKQVIASLTALAPDASMSARTKDHTLSGIDLVTGRSGLAADWSDGSNSVGGLTTLPFCSFSALWELTRCFKLFLFSSSRLNMNYVMAFADLCRDCVEDSTGCMTTQHCKSPIETCKSLFDCFFCVPTSTVSWARTYSLYRLGHLKDLTLATDASPSAEAAYLEIEQLVADACTWVTC